MLTKKLFLMTSQETSFSELKEEIVAVSNVWVSGVEEISSEELPFENFNKMTSGNGLIIHGLSGLQILWLMELA